MFIATKTLTITEDAYERLLKAKEIDESFSEIIVRHFPKRSLSELIVWNFTKFDFSLDFLVRIFPLERSDELENPIELKSELEKSNLGEQF